MPQIYFYNFMFFEPRKCCSVIRLVGVQRTTLNQKYKLETDLVSKRPYYVDEIRNNAVWFDGEDWMIGPRKNIDEGNLSVGAMFDNDKIVDCPSNVTSWYESVNHEWEENLTAKLFCDS